MDGRLVSVLTQNVAEVNHKAMYSDLERVPGKLDRLLKGNVPLQIKCLPNPVAESLVSILEIQNTLPLLVPHFGDLQKGIQRGKCKGNLHCESY